EHALPHEVCGKVIVATSEAERPRLEELKRRGDANGVPGLALIGRERLLELEPHCAGIAALHVPSCGIADFAAVARKYAELLATAGGEVITDAAVLAVRRGASEQVLQTSQGDVAARLVVNCAG